MVVAHFGATVIGSVIDLRDVRIPVTHLLSQSPGHEQALAAKVFYLDHHVIWQSLAPDRFSSELR
jgi:hypothetical protein